MNKPDLLKCVAETGYNVGFGAKRHFATYDIISKVPGLIGLISTGVGVFALFIDSLSTKQMSAAFIVLGVVGICIGMYENKKDDYAKSGERLTDIFNRLKNLYYNVKAAGNDLIPFEEQLRSLQEEYRKIAISDQILFSGWFAHYKFFWEHQIEWIDEQKRFRLFRDKLPLSFTIFIISVLTTIVIAGIMHWMK